MVAVFGDEFSRHRITTMKKARLGKRAFCLMGAINDGRC